MTTFTKDQIKKISETLGDEAVAKLTLPKVRVPKYVSGRWLAAYAQIGVKAVDSHGDTVTYRGNKDWDGYGFTPTADSDQAFTIEEWPNGEIYNNCPPPGYADTADNTTTVSELKAGDAIESAEQLDSLPTGSVVAFNANMPWSKYFDGKWVHCWSKGDASSGTLLAISQNSKITVLRVGWES